MPKAYWITTYREIKDPAKVAAYAKLAPVALAPFGVRYLCRGVPDATFEAESGWSCQNSRASNRRSPGLTDPPSRKRCGRSAMSPCATSESSAA
jgi:uncharacterized protein DUF1330